MTEPSDTREIALGEDRFRRRPDGDWDLLTQHPEVYITFGSTDATERRWRQLALALNKIDRFQHLLTDLLTDCDNWGCAPSDRYAEALGDVQ